MFRIKYEPIKTDTLIETVKTSLIFFGITLLTWYTDYDRKYLH